MLLLYCDFILLVIDDSDSEQTTPAAKKPRSVQGKFIFIVVALFYTMYSNELILFNF